MNDIDLENVYIDNAGLIKAYGDPKGIVETVADLPDIGVSEKDVYSVLAENGAYYYYNGSAWNKCGGVGLIKGEAGINGTSAGFGTPTATVDANVGTPAVTVTATGSDTKKVFNFAFKNLKGEKGDQGLRGATGETGATGDKGEKGDTGSPGANGVSCTHSWNGTTLTVTSASGTSSANLKGEKGDKGDPAPVSYDLDGGTP